MRDLQGKSPFFGGAVAMGNFDGLHQGHIRVLDQLRKMPKPWTVLSFYPSSRDYFNDNHKYIASQSVKIQKLAKMGVDCICSLPFSKAIQGTTWNDFLLQVTDKFAPKVFVLGEDFQFGYAKKGSIKNMEQKANIKVVPIEKYNSRKISSSQIRKEIMFSTQTNLDTSIEGLIIKGEGRGKEIGFPTINIVPDTKLALPICGVYIVQTSLDSGHTWYDGVANWGHAPTFNKSTKLLEVHLFNFSQNLYNYYAQVKLLQFIRPIEKFDDISSLVQAINNDKKRAIEYFNSY
jgi:riboflavin kinase/FMN adenylyltransferase